MLLFLFSGNCTAHRFAERYGDYIEEGAPSSEVRHKVFKERVSGPFTPNVSDNSDDTSDTVLIENNRVARKWVATPVWSNSNSFNKNSITSVIAEL